MNRQTILGPYELIDGYWCSQGEGIGEGGIAVIEGKLYHGVKIKIHLEEENIATRLPYKRVMQWQPVTLDMLHDSTE